MSWRSGWRGLTAEGRSVLGGAEVQVGDEIMSGAKRAGKGREWGVSRARGYLGLIERGKSGIIGEEK